MRTLLLALAALVLATAQPRAQPRSKPPEALLVFAAVSLTEAMQDVGALWEANGEPRPRFNFAATPTLARQIEQGAVASIFASADEPWMNWAEARGLIATGTRRAMLGNRLVLIAPIDQVPSVTIAPGMDLAALLGPKGRLATGDPASVPAGIYARQALTSLGLWAAIEPRLARTDSVRTALMLVERGEAPLGIVYATDATVSRRVAIAATFPAGLTAPINYPFAITRAGDTPAAHRFLAFLATPAAQDAFARRGFTTE